MLVFPNAKINIGLRIIRRRPDGYHDLESLFCPVPWEDALEVLPAGHAVQQGFVQTGLPLQPGTNLVEKARDLLAKDFDIPPLGIHLHKCIPSGAGLGGGSADAAFALRTINEVCKLGLDRRQLEAYAEKLGSDCPFFIRNQPCRVTGRGEFLEEAEVNLGGWHVCIVYPDVHISTAEAFAGVKPREHTDGQDLMSCLKQPVDTWKDTVVNDFEASVFPAHPVLAEIKRGLYDAGAVYASMSGSGSAVYGLFREMPADRETEFPGISKRMVL
ncbi:MAG: 4-(cytidine 5'-diphospho)-2-C-methyl-D-erythritol kinase [Flavobacteriales bacterium]|nr:4-(cytidine 5'-diphospho)-2-C-methyl-D-erythritol kinase [Flavobacteriales bacterium]MCB9446788.1 4-(cytidine 5'-diphospho)-2-C-methyl-D-erythritol kinase [Flavobacteriales bacterium]